MIDSNTWIDFFFTFLATVAGAGVGVLGLMWVFRRESGERYEARLTDALSQASREITMYIYRPPALKRDRRRENFEIGLILYSAATVARGRDADLVLAMGDACYEDFGTAEQQMRLFQTIAGAITGWRCHIQPFQFYLSSITQLAESANTQSGKGLRPPF